MNRLRSSTVRPIIALVITGLILILVAGALEACVPSNAQQTLATPATPVTDVRQISPNRSKQPSASPATVSRPSVSPSANAVIPSPGQTAVPTSVPEPSPFPTPSPTNASVSIDLTAQNLAFDKKSITVKAGADVTINFNNKDAGIQNNFAVYKDKTANDSIFVGDVITGPDATTYEFTAPDKAGTYFFRSDSHPAMSGDFIVQ